LLIAKRNIAKVFDSHIKLLYYYIPHTYSDERRRGDVLEESKDFLEKGNSVKYSC
jgi:hypothetical protein